MRQGRSVRPPKEALQVKHQNRTGYVSLIAGAALAAMTLSHAFVLALDRVLGNGQLGYHHVALVPALGLGALLLVWGVFSILRHLTRAADGTRTDADWLLPSLARIRSIGPLTISAAVLVLQTAALFAGESLEQHLAGVTLSGIPALFGSSLAVAPLLHFAVGIAAGLALWLSARAVCSYAAEAAAIVRAAAQWLSRITPDAATPQLRALVLAADAVAPPVLSRRIANRPPPA